MEDHRYHDLTGLCTEIMYLDSEVIKDNIDFEARTCTSTFTCESVQECTADVDNKANLLMFYQGISAERDSDSGLSLRVLEPKCFVQKFKKRSDQHKATLEMAFRYGPGSLKEIQAIAGCSATKARKAVFEMKLRNNIASSHHHRSHTQEDIEKLDQNICDPKKAYYTSRMFKREAPQFSRPYICRRLKQLGYRYKTLYKQPRQPRRDIPMPDEFLSILRMFKKAIENNNELIFIDQFKLVFKQTPNKTWQLKGEGKLYDDRAETMILTACVACDTSGYLCCQFFLSEMKSEDFKYFTRSLLGRFARRDKVVVFLDRAPWHKSSMVENSDISQFLKYNIPGYPMMNLIENSFSYLRLSFRSRPIHESLADECYYFFQLLKEDKQRRRFKGYSRN